LPAFSFTRRKFSAESSTTTTAASKPATPAPSSGAAPAADGAVSSQSSTSGAKTSSVRPFPTLGDLGTIVGMGLGGVFAAAYAAYYTHDTKQNMATLKAEVKDLMKTEKEVMEKALAGEKEVLKAQADSVKSQAWLAYLGPYAAAGLVGFFVAMKGK
jgi:hypothetical protein